jgi:hypothetical protein
MPILNLKASGSAAGRVLLAGGLGAVFGFQCWQLAEFAFDVSVPWYASLWLFLSQALLGLGIGVIGAPATRWKCAPLMALVLGVPSALGAHALGLRWAPHGVAVVAFGLAAGLFNTLITNALFPRAPAQTGGRFPLTQRPGADRAKTGRGAANALRQRLAEEKARLEYIDAERERRGNQGFGRASGDRIVWGELLELELQIIDEELNRIRNAAGHNGPAPGNVDRIERLSGHRRSS